MTNSLYLIEFTDVNEKAKGATIIQDCSIQRAVGQFIETVAYENEISDIKITPFEAYPILHSGEEINFLKKILKE